MDETLALVRNLASKDGMNETLVSGVRIYRASRYQPRQPLNYDQGVVIVFQGTKRIFLGTRVHEYNPENYLVLTVPLPAECETLASVERPLLSMMVDLDMVLLNRIIAQMDQHIDHSQLEKNGAHQGLFLAQATPDLHMTVYRLLSALQSPVESKVIGPGLVHELVFRIMCGENASSLYALAMKNTHLARVDKALKLMHVNYRASMDIGVLAGIVNMSPSAFHRVFKEVTSSSPIQYLKKVRLDKARSLLVESGARVNEAATAVGYESVSQFSREFKRYYGISPTNFVATSNT